MKLANVEYVEHNTAARRNVINVDEIKEFANLQWPKYEIFSKECQEKVIKNE